jgi:hypothetical protein
MATVKLALTTMIGLRDCRDVLGSQARTGGVDDLLVDSGGCFSFLARWYRVYAGPLTGCSGLLGSVGVRSLVGNNGPTESLNNSNNARA